GNGLSASSSLKRNRSRYDLQRIEERTPMRKLKYYVASTVDGFIGHEDGSVNGFLEQGEHVTDYLESLKTWFDVVLMGRKTYEFGFQFGVSLLSKSAKPIDLELTDSKVYENGVLLLHYRVKNDGEV